MSSSPLRNDTPPSSQPSCLGLGFNRKTYLIATAIVTVVGVILFAQSDVAGGVVTSVGSGAFLYGVAPLVKEKIMSLLKQPEEPEKPLSSSPKQSAKVEKLIEEAQKSNKNTIINTTDVWIEVTLPCVIRWDKARFNQTNFDDQSFHYQGKGYTVIDCFD